MTGRAGSILFQAHLHHSTGDPKFKSEIENSLEYIFGVINNSDELSPSFCNGLAGIGWLLVYLKAQGLIENDLDIFLQEADDFLAEELDGMLYEQNFDMLHGALGIGLYFLSRNKEAEVQKIVAALSKGRIAGDNEIKWKSYKKHSPNDFAYDFGLPHGMAGVLFFLGKCYVKKIMLAECLELMKGLICFYANNEQNIESAGSYYPYAIACGAYKAGEKEVQESRLAWCYGDLGIGYTLLRTAMLLSDYELREKSISMLVRLSQRRGSCNTLVSDITFCHGASGNGYIFLKAFELTQLPVFEEAADFWASVSLKLGDGLETSVDSYLTIQARQSHSSSTLSLLSGLAGVGIFYNCLLNKGSITSTTWDECLFLS